MLNTLSHTSLTYSQIRKLSLYEQKLNLIWSYIQVNARCLPITGHYSAKGSFKICKILWSDDDMRIPSRWCHTQLSACFISINTEWISIKSSTGNLH
jgi:hypothetical protein